MFGFFRKAKVSEEVEMLAKHLVEHPEEWCQDEYGLRSKSNPEIFIWTANGADCVKIGKFKLNLAERHLIYSIARKAAIIRICS